MKYDVIVGKKTYAVGIKPIRENFYEVRVDGTLFEVDARKTGTELWTLLIGHQSHDVDVLSTNGLMHLAVDGQAFEVDVVDELRRALRERKGRFEAEGPQQVLAPMPGKVVKVLVKPGDAVEDGQGMIIVEAMKMENLLKAQFKGVVKEVFVAEGQAVEARVALVTVEPV